MGRRITLVGLLVVCLVAGSWYLTAASGSGLTEAVGFGDLYDVQAAEIIELLMRSGNSGEMVRTGDPEIIAAFLEIICDLALVPDRDQEPGLGWNYTIDLYQSQDSYTRVTVAGQRLRFAEANVSGGYRVQHSPLYVVERNLVPWLDAMFAATQ